MRYFLIYILLIGYAKAQTSLTFTKFENDTLYYVLPGPEDALKEDIDDLLLDPSLLNANVGISVYSITKREFLYQKNSNRNFIPASLLKLFTSYSSLFFLGEDYKFTTELYYRGYLSNNGVLDGDLIIFSNGDPSLSPHFVEDKDSLFYEWLLDIDSIGIKKITGNIVADASWFDDQYYPDSWQIGDLVYEYSAPVSSFNYNNNSIELKITPTNIGDKALLEIIPNLDYFSIKNSTKTVEGNSFENIEIEKSLFRNSYEIEGYLSLGNEKYTINKKISVSEPESFYLRSFKKYLLENNIEINGGTIIKSNEDARIDYNECILINQHFSQSLGRIVREVNINSDNLISETLLKTIAKEKTGVGSFDNGIGQIKKLADDIGINSRSIAIEDGSGLSRMNLLTPKSIVNLLTYINKSDDFEVFKNSLAKPGVGTLEKRMLGSLAEENLWAKTGSLTNVSNIAGYIRTEENELLAFALMINNFTSPINSVRNIQDLICMRLSAFTRIFKIEKDKLKNLPGLSSSPNNKSE